MAFTVIIKVGGLQESEAVEGLVAPGAILEVQGPLWDVRGCSGWLRCFRVFSRVWES